MKKILFLLIFFTALFLPPALAAGREAYADSAPIVTSATALNGENERVPYTFGAYGREIRLEIGVYSPKLKVVISRFDGSVYNYVRTTYYAVSGGKVIINITDDGELTLVLTGVSLAETPLSAEIAVNQVCSDNSNPPAPVFDAGQFAVYRNEPFTVEYTLVRDGESGINFARSYLSYQLSDGTELFKTLLIENYGVRFTDYITGNGALVFDIFDYVGNEGKYIYNYTRYGRPESGPPEITVTPETGYAKALTVGIYWGAEYENQPYAAREYSLDGVIRSYTAPFTIATEGDHDLTAYYYQGGERRSESVVINRVDITPPPLSVIRDSIRMYCDPTESVPIYALLRATDALSGIAAVRLSGGEAFTHTTGDYYKIDISGLSSLTIAAEDNAGNLTTYDYVSLGYDYATVSAYSAIFKNLHPADYTADGWNKVVGAFKNLGTYIVSTGANSNGINNLKRLADAAVEGKIIYASRIINIPDGLPGGFTFGFGDIETDFKKGDEVKLNIDRINSPDYFSRVAEVKNLSGLAEAYAAGFTLYLTGKEGAGSLTGELELTVTLPNSAKYAKLYILKDGSLVQIPSTVNSGTLFATVGELGEFYVAYSSETAKKPGFSVGGKRYSWEMIGVAAGTIGGAVIIAIAVILIINKKRK
jgi:hypothetical protein